MASSVHQRLPGDLLHSRMKHSPTSATVPGGSGRRGRRYRGVAASWALGPKFHRRGKEDYVKRSRRLHSLAWLVLMATLVAGLAISLKTARAEVPSRPPTFSNPLNINNAFFPFQPGGLKDHGTKVKAIDHYLTATRTFRLNGKNVACHILVEEAYEDGELVERSLNYFAQADDGAVYYFGEVVNIYANGVIVSHEGSWLVGGATLPSDPPGIGNAPQPGLFMPANPELGDVFKQEDLFPIVDETDEVVGIDLDVLVPAGKYDGAIAINESSRLDPATEIKWYAPGVGVVKVQAKGETLRLESSTLGQSQDK